MKLSDFYCGNCGIAMFNIGDYYYCQRCKMGVIVPPNFLGIPEGTEELEVISLLPEDAYQYDV